MGAETKIEWAEKTWSPWEGCVKVNSGCRFCYAEARNLRIHRGKHWGPAPKAVRRMTAEASWKKVAFWNRWGQTWDYAEQQPAEGLQQKWLSKEK